MLDFGRELLKERMLSQSKNLGKGVQYAESIKIINPDIKSWKRVDYLSKSDGWLHYNSRGRQAIVILLCDSLHSINVLVSFAVFLFCYMT